MPKNLTSSTGLIVVAVLLLAVIFIAEQGLRGVRLDLTENRLYTLSDGARGVIAKLEEPINLYLFYSRESAQGLPFITNYAQRVEEMLEEMAEAADGNIRLSIIDPQPFSDEEDRAVAMGVEGVPIEGGDTLYFGIAGSNAVDETASIPFLQSDKEELLEYDLAKLIYQLGQTDKPVVGLLSTLDVAGGFDPRTMQPSQPWIIVEQLQQLFDVRTLERDIAAIDPEIQLLVVIQPTDLAAATLYALDQFLLGGGKALIFADPFVDITAATATVSEEWKSLLGAWGVRMDSDKFLADASYALQVSTGRSNLYHLGFIGLPSEAMTQDDVVTRGLESINLAYAGIIEPREEATTTVTPLLQSSEGAMPMDAFRARTASDPRSLQRGFNATGEQYLVAARINGPAASAFDAPPPIEVAEGESAPERPEHRANAVDEGINLILVADADLLSDRLWVQALDLFGQRLATAFASNGDLVTNAVDNLLGSSELISIRTRASYSRPFTKVEALEREAELNFRKEEQALQEKLRETERKLGELQAQKRERNAVILSAAQEAELNRFQEQMLETRKQLRAVRHELDRDIEALGSSLKLINIALIPLLVTLGALLFNWQRSRRNARLLGGAQ